MIEGVFSLEDPELEELYPLLLTGLLALPPILPRDIDLWLITGEALAEFPLLTCWQGDLLKGIDNKTVDVTRHYARSYDPILSYQNVLSSSSFS